MVAINAISVMMIAFDLTVREAAWTMPSLVAVNGPRLNRVSPLNVNGRENQSKRISRLTIKSRRQTLFRESLAKNMKEIATRIEGSKATKRSETATTIENEAAIITLALGSSRCITEWPMRKSSPIK